MSNRVQRFKEYRQRREEGKFNGAPLYYTFPRVGQSVPMYPRGKQMMLLGGSGTGKSQSWIGMVLMPLYNLIKKHDYKAKIFIFLLEDDLELLESRLFCRVLMTKYNVRMDPLELNSMKKELYSKETEKLFDEVDKIVEDVLSYCVVVDNVINPTGIYKRLRSESNKIGKHTQKEIEFVEKDEQGNATKRMGKVYDKYIQDDPELHCFAIIDNLNNLSPEGNGTRHDSIGKWCRDYARLQITKHWGWTVYNIMQTALDSDKKQFDNRGNSITEKLEPNLDSLGNNKEVVRDHHFIWALFNPFKFGMENYEGYDIERLKDAFRSLIIIKSNFSLSNIKFPLYFDGATSYFKELPVVQEMGNDQYKMVENRDINKFNF